MRNRQVQPLTGHRRFKHLQLRLPPLRAHQGHARVLLIDQVVVALVQQLLERLHGTGHRFELEIVPGIVIELLAVAVADQRSAIAAFEVRPLTISKGIVLADPDNAADTQERRADEVHLLLALLGQEVPRHQVDTPATHLFLCPRPWPAVYHLHVQAKRVAHGLEQVGIGPDQLLRVVRVTPEIRRVLRIAGSGQLAAHPLCHRQFGQNKQAQQQQQRPATTMLDHLHPPEAVAFSGQAWSRKPPHPVGQSGVDGRVVQTVWLRIGHAPAFHAPFARYPALSRWAGKHIPARAGVWLGTSPDRRPGPVHPPRWHGQARAQGRCLG